MSFLGNLIRDLRFIGIFLSFLIISSTQPIGSVKTKTYFYTYKTNITLESQKPTILRTIHGQVYLTQFFSEDDNTDIKLWQVSLIHKVPKNLGTLVLEVVTIQKSGLIDRILIPDSQTRTRISELNLLKGLLSLFNVRKTFEPGYEIDSSGECQVSYALVDDKDAKAVGTDYFVVDKLKQGCQRLGQPLDEWHESSMPVGKIYHQKEMITRYKVDTLDAKFVRISGFEKHTYSPMNNDGLSDLYNMTLVSWQDVEFRGLMAGQTEELRQKLSHLQDIGENEVGSALFGPNYQTIHLTLAHSSTPTSCGLNTNLYPQDSQSYSADYLIKTTLRRQLESVQNTLESTNLGQIQHTHPLIQLVQSLRCLPDSRQSVELLTELTLLASPAIDSDLLFKQANTWRDQLVDVVVSCGTGTCIDVLLRRLEDLTTLVVGAGKSGSKLPVSKLQVYEKMLFNKLWPSLSHLKRLRSDRMEQLIKCCRLYEPETHRQICLITLANLWIKVIDKKEEHSEAIRFMITELLKDDHTNKNENNVSFLKGSSRKKMMVGILAANILQFPSFVPILLDIALKRDNVPIVMRTLALRSAISIQFSDQVLLAGQNNYEWSQMAALMKEALLKPFANTHDDLLLGQELFRGLLQGEIPINEVADLLNDLSQQKRWQLVRIGRTILSQWCESKMISSEDCFCIQNGSKNGSDVHCRLGMAASWWGLAGDNQTQTGKATLLNGELVNMKDSLVVDYSSVLVLGSGGGLRMSDLVVNLLSTDADLALFEFGMYADGLDAMHFGLGSSKKSTESEETWFTLNLRILGTNLAPWEVFSGGLSQIIQLFWSAPTNPTSVLQSIQVVLDERIQTSFSSGWTIMLDSMGVVSLDLAGALETSIWTQTGRSLVRTRLGVVVELQVYVQDLFPESNLHSISQGLGFEGHIDFVTEMDLKNLPQNICMGMNRAAGVRLITYERQHLLEDMMSRRKKFVFKDLSNPLDYAITLNTSFPPVSYNLGLENSMKCKQMKSNTLW